MDAVVAVGLLPQQVFDNFLSIGPNRWLASRYHVMLSNLNILSLSWTGTQRMLTDGSGPSSRGFNLIRDTFEAGVKKKLARPRELPRGGIRRLAVAFACRATRATSIWNCSTLTAKDALQPALHTSYVRQAQGRLHHVVLATSMPLLGWNREVAMVSDWFSGHSGLADFPRP
jgi:hypothetical protein